MKAEGRLVGCLILGAVALVAVSYVLRPRTGTEIYRFPKGFHGRASVTFAVPGGAKLPTENGVIVYSFPKTGQLIFADSYDTVANRWFSSTTEFSDGSHLPIAEIDAVSGDEVRLYEKGVEMVRDNTVYRLLYFVGTPSEYRRTGY